MAERNLSMEKKQTHMENRILVAKGDGVGWWGSLRSVDANRTLRMDQP